MFATQTNKKVKTVGEGKPQRVDAAAGKDSLEPNPVWQSLALSPLSIQPKLVISSPNDPYEREADRIADQVMGMATPPSSYPKGSSSAHPSYKAQRKCASCEDEEEKLDRKEHLPGASSAATMPPINQVLRSLGQPLDSSTREFMEPRFGHDFSQVRVHANGLTTQTAAHGIGARAFTLGRNVVFGAGEYNPHTQSGRSLLAHELAHVVQSSGTVGFDPNRETRIAHPGHAALREVGSLAHSGGRPSFQASEPTIFRQVVPRAAARLTAVQILGDPAAVVPVVGKTLNEFKAYTREQADWFVEPTLSAGTNRDDLWRLLLLTEEGSHILSGIGDLQVSELRTVSAADMISLRAFCRGTHSSTHTVRIFPPFPALAERIRLGRTLAVLEAAIPPAVLEVTVSHTQLLQVQNQGLLLPITTYWIDFQPHLEQPFTPSAAGRGPEFDRVLTFLNSLGAPGLGQLTPLRGASPDQRWVRNLHRFPLAMLLRLVANFADTTGAKRLVLVLHTGHDPSASFQVSAGLFSNLVLNSPGNLVLIIEGATSLAAITARIPTITSTWGQIVAGTRRISQVIIAGHGSAQTTGLAGTGAPTVIDGHVSYPQETLNISTPATLATTQALLDALLTNMPPAAARILYAGCLVGSTHIPAGTPAAAIPGALAAHQSLGAFTEARAAAAGIPAGRVQAARASVGLGAVTSLYDAGTGDIGINAASYAFDENAYGTAASYTPTGREPEGVLRAAVEIGSINPVTAATLLRTRLGVPARPDWYDIITRLLVTQAVPAVVGGGVNLALVNELANVAEVPFLVFWPEFNWIDAAAFRTRLNPQPFAAAVYAGLVTTAAYTAPVAQGKERLRVIIDQGKLARLGAAEVPTFLAGVLLTGLHADSLDEFLDFPTIVPHGALLLPTVGAPAVEQIRLGLAWFARQPANPDVRSFLRAQVRQVAGQPASFTAAVSAEIIAAGLTDRDILDPLGFLAATAAPPAAVGGAPQTFANLPLPGSAMNTILLSGRPYLATVTAAPSTVVRRDPADPNSGFEAPSTGLTVRVMGFTAAWAAVDRFGRLGFVSRADLSPPPP